MKQILFPCDLSVQTERAFKQLIRLAVPLRVHVTLFHAREPMTEWKCEERAQRQLHDYRKQLARVGTDSDLLIMPGMPGPAIIAAARYRRSDLIVLGSRGLGPGASFWLSSTSTYVLQHSACPTLILPSRI